MNRFNLFCNGLREIGRAICKVFDFTRHNGKAASRLARAGGFDRGIQCKKVNLIRDGIDEFIGIFAKDAVMFANNIL